MRRLLRDNATGGWIRLALDARAGCVRCRGLMGRSHGYIIARGLSTREAVGMCEWSVRESFVDGEPRLLAYLGALRVAPHYRHRLRVLKGGFRRCDGCCIASRATPYALTAIAAEKHGARACWAPGFPACRSIVRSGCFSTFALRPRAVRRAVNIGRRRAMICPR